MNYFGFPRFRGILPLVYDNSLSYYEQLCKMRNKLNELIEFIKSLSDLPSFDYEGTWDDGIEYPKYAIVSYNNKIYVALKDVPIGTDIENTEYWSMMGEFDFAIEEVTQQIDELSDKLDEEIDAINNTLEDGFPHKNVTYHETIYVHATQGNDANNGRTESTPIKTLDKALEIMNNTASGVYIRFIGSGAYTMSYPVISGAMIHFLFDASNVTLNWLNDADDGWTKCFYNCYINMHGNSDGTSKLYLKGNRPAYLEGGKITISNMEVFGATNAFGIVGGAIQSQNNIWHTHVYITASRGFFQGDTFASVSPYHTSYIHIYNCSDVLFRGGVTFKNAYNSNLTNILSVTGSTVRVMQDIILDGLSLSDIPIYGASSQFLGGENRLMSWLNPCNLDRTMVNEYYFTTTTAFQPS